MNRPREYCREEVLKTATELFWEKGFEGTSMNELVQQTLLNKHSMYSEFGDKEGLFLACLDYYVNEITKELGKILTRQPLGLNNIEAFFKKRVEYAASGNCHGCLIVNLVTEQQIVSAKINDRIQSILIANETRIYDCLKAAQKNGEIGRDKDCKVLAGYLGCFLRGLMNLGRSNKNKKMLRKLTHVALSAVKN